MIGIDNGLKGGIVVLAPDESIIATYRMPVRKKQSGKGQEVDPRRLEGILSTHCLHETVLEVMHGAQDFRSAASMAASAATIKTVLALAGMQCQEIRQSDWKKMFWKKKRACDLDDKQIALSVATKQWPDQNWIPPRCQKPHDGIIDAALIALWGLRARAGEGVTGCQ